MTKKVGITLPDAVFDSLEEKAGFQGRTPTALAAFLIEYCLVNNIGFVESPYDDSLSSKFLKALAEKNPPSNRDLARLSLLLNIPVEVLISIRGYCLGEGRQQDLEDISNGTTSGSNNKEASREFKS